MKKRTFPFIKLKRICQQNRIIHIYEDQRLFFGFTELGWSLSQLKNYFKPLPLIHLKQIHSNRIHYGEQGGALPPGDGIILREAGKVAIIQTADCVPLFFFIPGCRLGGIAHVGWRGFSQGIEKKMVAMIKANDSHPQSACFFLGPAIEKKCYPVGAEIFRQFSNRQFAGRIFSPLSENRYLFDLKKGIRMSLILSGAKNENIRDFRFCTYCQKENFPSYRRDGPSKRRIYSFLAFK